MKNILLIFSFAVLLTTAFASTRSGEALSTEVNGPSFKAHLKEGFHFNEKAPNAVAVDEQTLKPSKFSARDLEFSGLPRGWSKASASVYVCDDAVTYCESHRIDLKAGGKEQKVVPQKTSKGHTNRQGFIENDLNQGLELAKKKNQLVLVDFSARWCPGCVRFETETFDTKAFKTVTKEFVKVKLDMDRFENQALAEKFYIKAIPTLLVMNVNQEEIDRLIDYQPGATVKSFFTAIQSDSTSIRELAEKGSDPARLGKRLLAAGRFKEATEALAKVQPAPPELLAAKIGAAETEFKTNKDHKLEYIKTLRSAIASEPGSSRSIVWRTSLAELLDDKAEIKKTKEDGVGLADALLKDPALLQQAIKTDLVGEFTGYEPLLIVTYRADLIEAAGADENEVQTAARKAAVVGRELKIPATKAGPALRYLIVLTSAQFYEQADKLAQELLKRDPNNGDIQRRRLKALIGLKKYPEAIALGKKALKNSYERNEIWVVEQLAKAYVGNAKNKEAKSLLDQYLSRSEIEWPNMQGSKKALQELRTSLN